MDVFLSGTPGLHRCVRIMFMTCSLDTLPQIIEHTGGWIGWKSVIARLPDDGVGIAVLTNWEQGSEVMETIKYQLLDKALKLKAVDWNSRCVSECLLLISTSSKITELVNLSKTLATGAGTINFRRTQHNLLL